MKRVLLAIGDQNYSSILRKRLSEDSDSFAVLNQEVLHHKYIYEILQQEEPELLIVHDYYLQSDKLSSADKEYEWLKLFERLRTDFDDSIRVVFLCEREKGDPFLSELVNRNVLDIFNNRTLDIQALINQLLENPKYANVAKFKTDQLYSLPASSMSEEHERNEDGAALADNNDKPVRHIVNKVVEKTVVNKVVEKKVVNKVVNKKVGKREYKVNVTNNVERVVGVPINKKLVMIGSPLPRAGSTFVSHLLAASLVEMGIRTTYVENPYRMAYTYDRFVGHAKAPDYRSSFYKFTKEIDPKMPSVFDWSLGDLNLTVKHPSNEPIYNESEIGFETFVKVLMSEQSPVTILDIGCDWHREIYQDLYDIADQVYWVLEPDISNLQYLEESEEAIPKFYRETYEAEKTGFIGNRFEESLMKHPIIKELFKEPFSAVIPSISSEDVFKAQYDGVPLNEIKSQKDLIKKSVMPLISELLPKEFLKTKTKESKWFKGIFNKSISIEKQ